MAIEIKATVAVDLSGLHEFQEQVNAQLNHQQEGPITKAFKQWGARYRSYIKERFDIFSKGGGNWPPLSERTKKQRRKGNLKKAGPKPRRPKIKVLKTGKIVKSSVRTRKGISADVAKGAKTRARIGKLKKQLAKVQNSKRKGFFAKVKKSHDLKKKIRKAQASLKKSKRAALVKANNKERARFKKQTSKWLAKRKFAILRDTGTLFAALSPTFTGKPGALEEGIPFGIRVGYGGPSRHPDGKATIADIASFHQTGNGKLPVREIIVAPLPNVIEGMARDMQRALRQLAKDNESNEGGAS